MFALHLAVSLAFTYVLYSLVEYSTHRFAMHRMKLARWFNSKFLEKLCYNHMALHHKRGYDHDDHEEDDKLSHILLAAACVGLPIMPVVYLIDPLTVLVCFVFGIVYSIGWWLVHLEMHRKEGRFFARNAVFRYLERRHQLHHLYPTTNYNVVLPLWDWIFRTYNVTDGSRRNKPARATAH